MNIMKKIGLLIDLIFLKLMQRFRYSYYLKHFPFYLKKIGVNFSGSMENTGFIASTVKFDSLSYAKYITIGENTIISTDVLLLVHDYSISTAIRTVKQVEKGKLPHFVKDIRIGSNCFIGARSIILPGTTIGDNVIIGAGTLVKGNIPDGVVVAGNPCKIIKTIEEYAKLHLEEGDFIGNVLW